MQFLVRFLLCNLSLFFKRGGRRTAQHQFKINSAVFAGENREETRESISSHLPLLPSLTPPTKRSPVYYYAYIFFYSAAFRTFLSQNFAVPPSYTIFKSAASP